MKKISVIMGSIIICFLMSSAVGFAKTGKSTPGADWKVDYKADKQQLQAERKEMRQDAQAARSEESELRQQIVEARKAGDMKRADELEAKLKSFHKDNVQDMKSDKKEAHEAWKDLQQDKKQNRS